MKGEWQSVSLAEDGAILALCDLCTIEPAFDFRVIGGVMQVLHGLRYPGTAGLRTTADADLGIEASAVAVSQLRASLMELGYEQTEGNRFVRGHGTDARVVDVLFPDSFAEDPAELAGVVADLAPGLHLALVRIPVIVQVQATLTTGNTIQFEAPIPDASMAVVLKVLAWSSRFADRDLEDVASLLRVWWQEREQVKTMMRRGVVDRAASVLERSVIAPPRRGSRAILSAEDRAVAREFVRRLGPVT